MVLLFIDSKRFDFMRFTRAMLLSYKIRHFANTKHYFATRNQCLNFVLVSIEVGKGHGSIRCASQFEERFSSNKSTKVLATTVSHSVDLEFVRIRVWLLFNYNIMFKYGILSKINGD